MRAQYANAENRTDAAMTSSHDWIVVALFKPTTNGWIFRAPNPWLFGRGPHYIVNDEQRAQIAELLRIKRPLRTIFALSAILLAGVLLVCAAMWALGGHLDEPTVLDLLMMFVLFFGPAIAGISITALIRHRRIAPILAGAPMTQETITNRDIVSMATPAQAKRSIRYFIVMILLWTSVVVTQVAQLVVREARHPLFTDALSWLIVGVLALALLNMLFAVVQATRHAQRTGS